MAVYKTQFERALLSVNISLNDAGQINGLLVKPFTEVNIARPGTQYNENGVAVQR
ncbi:MAG: hypothetical protein QM743_13325 [Chitinophagaceae bacterium]